MAAGTRSYPCDCCSGGPPPDCCLFGHFIPTWLTGIWKMTDCEGASFQYQVILKKSPTTNLGSDCLIDYITCNPYTCPFHPNPDPDQPPFNCNGTWSWAVRLSCDESGHPRMSFQFNSTAIGNSPFFVFKTYSFWPPIGNWFNVDGEFSFGLPESLCCCPPLFGDAGCNCNSVTFRVTPFDVDPSVPCPPVDGMMMAAPIREAAPRLATMKADATAGNGKSTELKTSTARPRRELVGTILMRQLVALNIRKSIGCGCDDLRQEMDEAGVAGVVSRHDYFAGELRKHAKKYGYGDKLGAAFAVARQEGIAAAARVAWNKWTGHEDEYAWLLRRAVEAAMKGGAG